MSELFSTDLSFKMIAAALLILFAIKAFVKGVLRQVWGMLCLALGGIAGYFIFRNGSEWLGNVIDHPSGNTVLAASVVGGGAVWLGGKGIVHKIYKGLTETTSDRTMTGRLVGAVVSLAPTSFLVWVIATVLRLTGTLSEMSHLDTAVRAENGTPATEPGLIAQLREELDQGWFGDLLKKTDPFTTAAGHQLASLLVLYNDSDAWARLKSAHPELANLLNHDKILRVLDDKEVRNSVAYSEHASLLLEPDVRQAAEDPEVARQLMILNVQETAQDVLYESAPERKDHPGGRFLRRLSGRGRF